MKAEGDSVKKHAARSNRKAMECESVLPRGKSDYSKKMVQFQLENGLGNSDIQEQILAEFTARPRMTLEETINLVEAKQMAKKDVAQLVINGGTEVNKVTIRRRRMVRNLMKRSTRKSAGLGTRNVCGARKEDILREELQRRMGTHGGRWIFRA